MAYKNGDKVRLSSKWLGANESNEEVYEIVDDVPDFDGKILIRLVCDMIIPPVETVLPAMLEAAK